MIEELSYKTMLHTVLDAVPSALFLVNHQTSIVYAHITQYPEQRLRRLYGKSLQRVLSIFSAENQAQILNCYEVCKQQLETVDIPKMAHTKCDGSVEYYAWQFVPLLEQQQVLCFIRNTTEDVLIGEEFIAMSEQYESVNRELYVAMSNLDLHLMDIEQAKKKISALYRITSIVQKTVNETEVLNEILDGITREFGFNEVAILLLDEASQELSVKACRGHNQEERAKWRIPVGEESISGYAALHRELVYIDDLQQSECRHNIDNARCVSEVAAPLIFGDKLIGVLSVETTHERVLQPYDLDLLRSLAGQIAMTLAHANHVANVQLQAITDGLTGLYNHRYFRSILEQEFKRAVRYQRPLSMIMIDIDYFKRYNDMNGHRMGDEVLKQVAALIRQNCRDVDFVVRYGGEEFSVLLPETDVQEAYTIARRILTTIAEHPFPNRHTQPGGCLTVSIGISGYPRDASTDIELIDCADAALYSVKRSTRNSVCLYNAASVNF